MKKITLLFAFAATTFGAAKAQVRFAPEVGAAMNKVVTDPSSSASFKIGPRIGGLADIALTEHLYLQPGIAFAMKGAKATLLGLEVNSNINYVEVPVNLVYKLGTPGGGRLFFGAGPYVAYGISGKTKTSGSFFGITIPTTEEDMTFGSDSSDVKALDFGGNVAVGYELPMGLYARAYYQMGFANLSNVPGSSSKNMGIGLAVGYMLGRKK
jgi:hypothetical protein